MLLLLQHCIALCLLLTVLYSCNNNTSNTSNSNSNQPDSLFIETQKHLPENALKGLTVANDLEVHTFATEPMLNPTNIDMNSVEGYG